MAESVSSPSSFENDHRIDPFEDYLDLLKQLVRCPSVVSAEHSFFRALQRELEETGADVIWYEGLLVAHGNAPDSAYLSAHIDRHGLICTGPNEFQYAAYVARNRGDLLGNSVSEATFNKVSARFHGFPVVAYEPWSGVYRGSGVIESAYVCPIRGNMVFEVRGLEYSVAGTPIGFQDRLRIEEGKLYAQLDNVLTAAMLVHLFRRGFQGTALFSAQEEAGRSWRFLLEWFQRKAISTQRLIVLDTSPYGDLDAAIAQDVVLRRRDANAVFDAQTVGELESLCRELGTTYTFKDEYIEACNLKRDSESLPRLSLGSTELGRLIVASDNKISGATLQVPTTGYHTSEEVASVAACRAFYELLCRLAGCE